LEVERRAIPGANQPLSLLQESAQVMRSAKNGGASGFGQVYGRRSGDWRPETEDRRPETSFGCAQRLGLDFTRFARICLLTDTWSRELRQVQKTPVRA